MDDFAIYGFERRRGPVFAAAGGGGAVGTGDLATGLVAYWPMSEGGGTVLADLTANANNATLDVSDQWNGGGDLLVNGQASMLFGGNHYGLANDIAAYDFTANISVVAWVHAVANDGQAQDAFVFSQYDWHSITGESWFIGHQDSTGKFNVRISDNVASRKDYTSSITCFDGAWHSIGFRWRADTGVLDLFVDGVKDPSPAKPTDASIAALYNSGAPIGFGCIADGTTTANSAFFKTYQGALRNPRIYNTLKSDALFTNFHAAGIT